MVYNEKVWGSFADIKPCITYNPISRADGPLSTSSQSTDAPYPVDIFKNKIHTSTNKSTTVQSYASIAMDYNCDQKPHHQMPDSDKPHTVTPQQVIRENLDSEVVGEGNYDIYTIYSNNAVWYVSHCNTCSSDWRNFFMKHSVNKSR